MIASFPNMIELSEQTIIAENTFKHYNREPRFLSIHAQKKRRFFLSLTFTFRVGKQLQSLVLKHDSILEFEETVSVTIICRIFTLCKWKWNRKTIVFCVFSLGVTEWQSTLVTIVCKGVFLSSYLFGDLSIWIINSYYRKIEYCWSVETLNMKKTGNS